MSKFKLFVIELIIALILGSFFSFLYIKNNVFFENLNNKIVDSFFIYRGKVQPLSNVVIVDIDEKSLKELGQWPWSRDIVAKILQNLNKSDVGIIGLDIVFAEKDNSSPSLVLKKLGIKNNTVPDYDKTLAMCLQNTPTISGYMFDFKENILRGVVPNISSIIVQKGYENVDYLPTAKGIISNIQILQESSFSSGFFNTVPDDDGIVRSVPLLVKYQDTIYPSLSLEILRLIYQTNKIVIYYSEAGISSIKLGELMIPTDRFGRLQVNYFGPSKLFKYISAVDIFNNHFKKEDIEGKVVLLGTSAGGLLDLRATPFESVYPGVEIHASAIENVLEQFFISHPSWVEAVDILIIFTLLILMLILFTYTGAITSATLFLLITMSFVYGIYYIFVEYGIIINMIYPLSSSAVLYMILTSLHYLFESRQKELVKNSFSKKVSKQVMDDLLMHSSSADLSAREVEATIYFSDIRSFTTISEKLQDPKKITNFLNYYMDAMVYFIENSSGTIDKFIGDAIMAYWNAPLQVENHADKAVQTALKQIEKRHELNKTIYKDFGFNVDYGIGINTGNVVVGEIGSKGRSDYTIIGDAVNLASRLEGLCKPYQVRLIISESTLLSLKEEYTTQLLDMVRVKGKDEAIKIYEVLSYGSANEEKEKELKLYMQGYNLYRSNQFTQAEIIFQELFHIYKKYLYNMYAQRSKQLSEDKISEFDGIYEFTTK